LDRLLLGPKKALSAGRAILQAAMQRQGLTAPKLAAKIGRILQPKSPNLKADRATIYRIIKGQTKKPQPAMRNALIEVLQLEREERETVWRELGGAGAPPSSSRRKKVYSVMTMSLRGICSDLQRLQLVELVEGETERGKATRTVTPSLGRECIVPVFRKQRRYE
jgi:hypothetical protein